MNTKVTDSSYCTLPNVRKLRLFRAAFMASLSLACMETHAADWLNSGHSKYQFLYHTYPEDSLFRDIAGAHTEDHHLNLRLKTSIKQDLWSFHADYQLIGIYGDTIATFRSSPYLPLTSSAAINDNSRLWDLTDQIDEENRYIVLHRLDRLNMGHTTEKTVIRIGRQAVSWGNGLFYTPMDIFNPFDPASIDKEYKTGDDMIYGQYLENNGDDLQLVYVARRNLNNGQIESDSASLAIKYHGFFTSNEYDLLIARHYNDDILALGGTHNLGEAVWRGDLVFTFLNSDTSTHHQAISSLVTSISYSWTALDTNFSGSLEYFYNGFGEHDNHYDHITSNIALTERIARGELYTIGKHYSAASVMIEITPLLLLSTNLFLNLEDQSSILQLTTQYDWMQNLQLLTALNLLTGEDTTEYGGIETTTNKKRLSIGPSIFIQLAWYF